MTAPKKKQNQPKHHASKSKAACALRRKKIIKAIAEGKTQKQAGIKAGLNPKTAQAQVSQILLEPNTQSSFKALLDKVISDDRLSEKYSQLLESKKCISAMVIAPNGEGMKDANSMTKDFVEVDDCAVQLKAADSISKLKGHLVEKVDVNHNIDKNLFDAARKAFMELNNEHS
jgi:DNA-binding CsgD family transcriptional regulator